MTNNYVDQVTELYPRPKMAAEFKRKIHYPRIFSVYRQPCPRWPRLNLTLVVHSHLQQRCSRGTVGGFIMCQILALYTVYIQYYICHMHMAHVLPNPCIYIIYIYSTTYIYICIYYSTILYI